MNYKRIVLNDMSYYCCVRQKYNFRFWVGEGAKEVISLVITIIIYFLLLPSSSELSKIDIKKVFNNSNGNFILAFECV